MVRSQRFPRDCQGESRVLLTVSGTVPADLDESIAAGLRPRADYAEMARRMSADLLDHAAVRRDQGRLGRVIARFLGPDVCLAWACYRRRQRYQVIVTDGEQVGLPLAALFKFTRRRVRARHLMVVHIMSVRKKASLFRALRLSSGVDRYIAYCSAQQRFLAENLGVAPDRIVLRPFMVDTAFFSEQQASLSTGPPSRDRPMICTAGLECRDYPTMLRAVEGLEADVVIAAASPWSKRASGLDDVRLPPNVTVVKLGLFELRQLYQDAAFVVMPLQQVEFQAGITTILEAMSMGRAVVCTTTPGQVDTLVDGETGRYVPPSDPIALRATIDELLAHPEKTARMGVASRAWVVQHADVEIYADAISGLVDGLRSPTNVVER